MKSQISEGVIVSYPPYNLFQPSKELNGRYQTEPTFKIELFPHSLLLPASESYKAFHRNFKNKIKRSLQERVASTVQVNGEFPSILIFLSISFVRTRTAHSSFLFITIILPSSLFILPSCQ